MKRNSGWRTANIADFTDHPNAQVSLMTASSRLTIVPDRAKKASGIVPQSVDAALLLRGMEDGSFVPK
jgi:hypothetical protein